MYLEERGTIGVLVHTIACGRHEDNEWRSGGDCIVSLKRPLSLLGRSVFQYAMLHALTQRDVPASFLDSVHVTINR